MRTVLDLVRARIVLVSETTGRLLAVLAALQARPMWSGPELAARLDVTVRTVRRDVERLRQLGYPVESEPGVAGGYRLGSGGSAVPPLMLDTDEAFALAVLVRASTQSVGDAAERAIAKLEQMVPPHLRRDIELSSTVIRVASPIDKVDSSILRTVSAACRASDELAVRYRDRAGRSSERRLLPHRVVSIGRRWYLVARDARKPEWRTWRVDRIESAATTGHRFIVGDPPDAVALVQRSISTAPYRHQARIELDAPVERIAELVPPSVGVLEAIDEHTTLLTTGADKLDHLALHVAMLDVGFRVLEPAQLRTRMAELAARLAHGAVVANQVPT
jgi:predicted DNA-binding transcriptional regulator YafY